MTIPPGIVQRAFELARSGECGDLEAVRKGLDSEGLRDLGLHITASPSLSKQLWAEIRAASRRDFASPPNPT